MTQAVTYLTSEDAAMWSAAGLAQLPRSPFASETIIQELAREGPAVVYERRETPDLLAVPCACGCGEPVTRARNGRPGLYVSAAHRMRALRARRRA
jgi:hypothetical protein